MRRKPSSMSGPEVGDFFKEGFGATQVFLSQQDVCQAVQRGDLELPVIAGFHHSLRCDLVRRL